ncbi:MAG: (4Fe-4S)-binding protein [Flavobacteriia bacterium]|nr:(4Fe-4S)-binding protein [Flavobacteriia bacterium]OIP46178.1 MAG: (4Fe-4S)-binding protein [Flavobacteriaceae bacterium CG2_30_31_66]PIV96966.1 MAG: (4Fe-4S)-binding protein [Flavobacteriaceae bacterium CG17_big_fil_post_rev_8_21_14_2_50_31_13]PIX12722.1 MAG: (4Fe-4S)-binding protein [Flavobacteriaceae bacterium CG_4_8_14_3_um_filter_31_8]PIY15272.1 MAG: (4Fe-4S)-binding protein [Flavobacteriaceae bacterium CG_4_10_14_3_um_filter_31_253]PIZ09689.1 MAG: (4Fe-4S)-binding protein [Flavobacter
MKTYSLEDVTICWKPEKCTHSANCVKQLSSVFKPLKNPWIQTQNATKQAIIEQIRKCPSGALSVMK